MNKRAVATVLWFVAIWVGYEIVWSVTGVPRAIGPIVATAVAGFVGLDPHGLFWARSAARITRSIGTARVVSAEY
jgi:hypothetical protein